MSDNPNGHDNGHEEEFELSEETEGQDEARDEASEQRLDEEEFDVGFDELDALDQEAEEVLPGPDEAFPEDGEAQDEPFDETQHAEEESAEAEDFGDETEQGSDEALSEDEDFASTQAGGFLADIPKPLLGFGALGLVLFVLSARSLFFTGGAGGPAPGDAQQPSGMTMPAMEQQAGQNSRPRQTEQPDAAAEPEMPALAADEDEEPASAGQDEPPEPASEHTKAEVEATVQQDAQATAPEPEPIAVPETPEPEVDRTPAPERETTATTPAVEGLSKQELEARIEGLAEGLADGLGDELVESLTTVIGSMLSQHAEEQRQVVEQTLAGMPRAEGEDGAPAPQVNFSPVLSGMESLDERIDGLSREQTSLLEALSDSVADIPDKTVTQLAQELDVGLSEQQDALLSDVHEQVQAIRAFLDEQGSPVPATSEVQDGSPVHAGETYQGRKRLPGFQVFSTSRDGEHAIVTAPGDQVNVYFEGERFRIPGRTMTVTGIAEDGWVVLVGDNWFIDATYLPRSQASHRASRSSGTDPSGASRDSGETQAAEAEPVPQQEPVRPEPSAEEVADAPEPTVTPDASEGNAAADDETGMQGWRVHAVDGNRFLLRDDDLDWHIARSGQSFQDYGQVGAVVDDALEIGEYRVPLSGR